MSWKQVEKWDEASEVNQDQPKDKRSWRPPKSRDEGCQQTLRSTMRRTERDHQKSTQVQKFTELHKSTELRLQSTTDLSLSRRRSNDVQKGGWPCQKCALHTSQKPTGRQSTETYWVVDREVYCKVDQSRPADKPKAHWDAIYRDMHREVDRQVYQVNKDSTEAAYWEQLWSWPDGHWSGLPKSTPHSSSIWTSMPLTNDYRLQEIIYRACESTAWRLKRAQARLNLVSITIVEKLTY